MISLLLILPIVAALNFEWTYEREKFWATEVAKFPRNGSSIEILSQIATKDVQFCSVGQVEWQQFNCTIQTELIPPGPYLISSSIESILFAKAYMIKDDPVEAFMFGSLPVSDGHIPFHHGIPISSGSQEGPLAGLRFAVKDIFHVKGLKTSGGSRAYFNTYGPQNSTAEVVAKSLVGGASLVGKTKTITFALGAPLDGWEVDYQDPWNTRGDGYQSTGGSSTGSGSAVTAYDWLDFAIGSDTGGSVRYPARFGGLYGYKPSHGIFDLTEALVAIAEQDTPGFLTRSPELFTRIGRWWAEDKSLKDAGLPPKLLFYADEPELSQGEAEEMKKQFFLDVSNFLGLELSSINVSASFHEHISTQPMSEYYDTVYADQNSVQNWDHIGKPLAEAFAAQNDGAFPPADPACNLTWFDGQNATTRERYKESQRRREKFANWYNSYILPSSDLTCSESIAASSLHIPPSMVKSVYTPVGLVRGYWPAAAASYAGFPEIVVPIGQIQYFSPYTLKMEWQPVTVTFAVAKGCDLTLFNLVDKLAKAGMLKEVLPGKVAYPTH